MFELLIKLLLLVFVWFKLPPSACPPACLQKAAALDPHNVALTPGPEGEAAAQRREEACYQHTMAVLRLLVDRTGVYMA